MPKPPSILVTRSPHQASALVDALRVLGAEPVLIPTIELTTPTTFAPLDAALAALDSFHWMIFTSANAVGSFCRRRSDLNRTTLPEGTLKIAAIGPATARALEDIGLTPYLIPALAIAESLATALTPYARQADGLPTRFLLVRAEEGREHLPETLRAAGASVTIAPAYRNVVPRGSVEALRTLFDRAPPDAITFTSSSTARNLVELLAAAAIRLPETVVRASIGPVTTQTLIELGLPPHTESPEATVASLAENVVEYLVRPPGLVR